MVTISSSGRDTAAAKVLENRPAVCRMSKAFFGGSVRREGLLSAGVSLATKVGMAIGTAGFAYVLAAAGYMPAHVSDGAREAIRWTYYGHAVLLLALQIGIALLWPMDGLRQTIRNDVAGRTLAST